MGGLAAAAEGDAGEEVKGEGHRLAGFDCRHCAVFLLGSIANEEGEVSFVMLWIDG